MARPTGQSPADAGIINARAQHPACRIAQENDPRFGVWVLVATIVGSSMAFIDGTVVNVALPAIQSELGATVSQAQWVVESYALTLAALILVGGSMGDHFGRRKVFGIGIALFALASAWCGLAGSTTELIIARAVQGIGGALLVPGSLAIIGAAFSDAERGRAIGTWSAFSAITTAVGPIMGGWLVDNLSWRWAFFINVPLAVFTLVILFWRVPESRDEEATGGLDWLGATLATLGLGGVVFGFIEQANLGWNHPLTILGLAGGTVLLAAFLFVEARRANPMMPLQLFGNRTFASANLLTLLLYAALSATMFYMPLNLIQVQGYSATAAGAAFLPFILIMFALSRFSGALTDRVGPKLPLVIGPILVAVAFFMFSLIGVGGSYWVTFFPPIVVMGLGMAISVPPLTTAVMASASRRFTGIASGINNAVSRTAGLLAIAIIGLFMFATFSSTLDTLLGRLDLPAEAVATLQTERINLGATTAPDNLDAAQTVAVKDSIDTAFVEGFRVVNYISAALALISAFVAALFIDGSLSTARTVVSKPVPSSN